MSLRSAGGGRPAGAGGPMGGGSWGAMGRPTEKAKDARGTLRQLMTYLLPHRTRLLIVFLLAILSTVFSVVGPKLLGQATTTIVKGFLARQVAVHRGVPLPSLDFDTIGRIALLLAGLYVVSALFGFLQQFIMAGIAQRIVYDLRQDVDKKLARLPLKYFDTRTHGEILSRVTNDIDTISTTLQQNLTQLVTSVVTIVGVIIMMLTISVLMTGIVLVTLPVYVVVTVIVAKRSQQYFAKQQKELGHLNGHIEEMYTGHVVVKAFGQERESVEIFTRINDRLYSAGWKAQFVSGVIMPLMQFVSNVGYVLVAVSGAVLVTRQQITIGDVQAFLQYAQQFTQPIVQTANIANVIQSTIAAAERVFELLGEVEEAPEVSEAARIDQPHGDVVLDDVSFRYDPAVPLIEHMSLAAIHGQIVAIVGPTGAGKTTLVNLLMRFYDVSDGVIRVDNVNIQDMRRGQLRRMFGMVLQDTWLFNGTIQANIGYGRENAAFNDIVAAAQAASADHFIRTLPDGYDTMLNEEASNISQGQKQLLTIARALLAEPTILILDEATSSVDSRTELLIQKAMTTLMTGRTSFVIAHRLSTIRDADLILVMNHGAIVEQGTHTTLLEAQGFYADLYNSQFTVQSVTLNT